MDIRQELGARLQQKLIPTPQLQIAIRLLQLSKLELVEEIRQQLDSNPALEEAEENSENLSLDGPAKETPTTSDVPPEDRRAADPDDKLAASERSAMSEQDNVDWEKYVESYNSFSHGPEVRVTNDEVPTVETTVSNKSSLGEHLLWQLNLSSLPPVSMDIGRYIIGNIDDDGYLVDVSDEDIAAATETTTEHVAQVLEFIQAFDPPGVASRTLQECLLVQAAQQFPENEKLLQMISDHLSSLEKRNFQAIARGLKVPLDEIKELIGQLQSLEPRPGREFSSNDIIYIRPDVHVIKLGNEYVVVVNDDGLPRLKISNYYEQTLSKQTTGDAKNFVKEKLRAASWLIKSINQRQTTIRKVTESIVKFQHNFLEHGVEHLKPLVLRDIADDVEMHESTISRVTTNKYVHTPQGIFELKFFFNSRISSSWGTEDHSSASVKSRIKALVDAEKPDKPLSDQEIVKILKKDDVIIARRTVAKYRESLGIPPSSRRRRLT